MPACALDNKNSKDRSPLEKKRLERLLEQTIEQTIWDRMEGERGLNRRGEDKETQVEHTW